MQDLAADAAHWGRLARERGDGWRVWRWEKWEGERLVWRFRLIDPGETPSGSGDVLEP